MALKSILAAYSGDAAGSSGLTLALFLARQHQAHMTGVVWRGPSPVESRFSAYMPQDVLDMLARREAEVAGEVRAGFTARVSKESGVSSSFIDLETHSEFSLAKCAQTYDLVVMGRRAAAVGRDHMASRPDVVALRSGSPVILVPHDFTPRSLGQKVVMAWDGKRASSRAIKDALPLLAADAQITVLSVGYAPDMGAGDDIDDLLRRHGLNVRVEVRPEGAGGVAQTLLDTCRELGADMMVMGAYEHSKFRQEILGGVTQDIHEKAHLPILMAH